jgi:hypothetical protein
MGLGVAIDICTNFDFEKGIFQIIIINGTMFVIPMIPVILIP